jgi:hypothetical protein
MTATARERRRLVCDRPQQLWGRLPGCTADQERHANTSNDEQHDAHEERAEE